MFEYLKTIDHKKISWFVEKAVFAIRWALIPLYIGLFAALGLYIVHFIHEVFEMFMHLDQYSTVQDILMLFVLELVDMTMISQLVVMTIQGGYAIFIRPFDYENLATRPQWLAHGLGTSEQKIKLGMSIMGIMMVQLLKNFIEITTKMALTPQQLSMRESMLGWVTFATFMFCLFNLMMHPPFGSKHDDHKAEGAH